MTETDGTRIFTFWEPRGHVTPYLQLCRETWDRRLAQHEIVVLDHSNMDEWAGAGTLDLDALEQVGLAAQKDAVMIAVLHRHGGLFMDMDTLVVDDLSPILETLRRTAVVMFEQHVAFVAARPGAPLMRLWLEAVKRNLSRISTGDVDPASVRWDYLGNAPLTAAYLELLDRSILLRTIRRSVVGRRFWPSAAGTDLQTGPSGATMIQPSPPRWKRIARAMIRARLADQMIVLDRSKHGFIAEVRNHDGAPIPPADLYRRFWFEGDNDTGKVLQPGVRVVALHNSWTPAWFRDLSREEVLAHECLLSRTLEHLLTRKGPGAE